MREESVKTAGGYKSNICTPYGTWYMSAIQTLPTPNSSLDAIRTVFRFSLDCTFVVLSTRMMAWFVAGSTYANFADLATSAVTKLCN